MTVAEALLRLTEALTIVQSSDSASMATTLLLGSSVLVDTSASDSLCSDMDLSMFTDFFRDRDRFVFSGDPFGEAKLGFLAACTFRPEILQF